MSLFTRLAPAALVLSMLAAGAGCAQAVDGQPDDSADVTSTTSSALTTNVAKSAAGTFILDIAKDLLTGNILDLINGEGIDYERINKMFEDDLQKYADKEHVHDAATHVTGALETLTQVLVSYDANAPVDTNNVRRLETRVDHLNNDLVSMRQEDAKKVGLRTYLWAATVQHTLLDALATIDQPNAQAYQARLRGYLQEHAEYVAGRIPEFQQDAATRLARVNRCQKYQAPFSNPMLWFDDQGANYGSDPAIPKVEGADYGDVANYRSDRAWAWGVDPATQAHSFVPYEGRGLSDCEAGRARYLGDMGAKLDVLNGFKADANLPDTRDLLKAWQDALPKLDALLAK